MNLRRSGGVALALTVGCSPQPAELDREWSSEHFVYHSSSRDRTVCSGVIDTLERHRAVFAKYLSLEQASTQPIHYYKYRDAADLQRLGHCRRGNAACFNRGRGVEAREPVERHELIHAYLAELGDSHPLLEEGMAEALSCAGSLRVPFNVEWNVAFDPKSWATTDISRLRRLYDAAASFVTYVLRRHGPERFLRWYAELRPGSSAESAAEAFARTHSDVLADVWARALAQDPEDGCFPLYECTTPPLLEYPPAAWATACDQSDHFRTLQLDELTWIREDARGYGARVAGCEPGAELPFAKRFSPGPPQLGSDVVIYVPAPGRYFIAQTEGATQMEFFDATGQDFLAGACGRGLPWRTDGAGVVTFALSGLMFDKALRSELLLWWQLVGSNDAGAYGVTCSEGIELQACSDCDRSHCETLCSAGQRPPVSFEAAGEVRFRIAVSASRDVWFELHRISQ